MSCRWGSDVRRVVIESPFAGNLARHIGYARAAVRDSINRGEAPFASHLIYTQAGVLRDDSREDRSLGIVSGFAWMEVCDLVAVYQDLGISGGMRLGIERAKQLDKPVEYRTIAHMRFQDSE